MTATGVHTVFKRYLHIKLGMFANLGSCIWCKNVPRVVRVVWIIRDFRLYDFFYSIMYTLLGAYTLV